MKKHVLQNSAHKGEDITVLLVDGRSIEGAVEENDGDVLVLRTRARQALAVIAGESIGAVLRSSSTQAHCPRCNETTTMQWHATEPYQCGDCDMKVHVVSGPSDELSGRIREAYEGRGKIQAIKLLRDEVKGPDGKLMPLLEAKTLVEKYALDYGWRPGSRR